MNAADTIKNERAGFTSRNILIRLTSNQVIDEAPASCAVSEWPLLCARGGIFSISQRTYKDTSAVFMGGIQRITGLGDIYTKLLNGRTISGSGSLDYAFDDSDLMLEVLDLDWTDGKIEVRVDYDESGWSSARELFTGILSDAEITEGVLSWRISSSRYLLDETIHAGDWLSNTDDDAARLPFGEVFGMPVSPWGTLKAGADFIYLCSSYDAAETRLEAYSNDGGAIATSSGNDYSTEPDKAIYMLDSSGWALNGDDAYEVPTVAVWVDMQGYDEGIGFASIQNAGSILTAAIPLAKKYENGGGTYPAALSGVNIDYTSLATFDTKCGYDIGIDFTKRNGTWGQYYLQGDDWTWLEVFDFLIGNSGGVYTFNNDDSLSFHWMLDAPTETPTVTIRNSDFVGFDVDKVKRYKYVQVTNQHGNIIPSNSDQVGQSGAYLETQDSLALRLNVDGIRRDLTIEQTMSDDFYARFGERDYKFNNCPIARGLNVGDVVTFSGDIDGYLDGTLKGYVIGVDRGTEPFIEVRA